MFNPFAPVATDLTKDAQVQLTDMSKAFFTKTTVLSKERHAGFHISLEKVITSQTRSIFPALGCSIQFPPFTVALELTITSIGLRLNLRLR